MARWWLRWGVLLASAMVCAEDKAATTAGQVMQANVQAMGGEEAWKRVQSVFRKGAISGQEYNWIRFGDRLATEPIEFENYAQRPGRRLALLHTHSGPTSYACDGDGWTWSYSRLQGLGKHKATGRDQFFCVEVFQPWPLVWQQLGWSAELKGAKTIDGRKAWLLHVIPDQGEAEDDYFDAATALLVRSERMLEGGVHMRSAYSDYREVEGVKFPFRIVTHLDHVAGETTSVEGVSEIRDIRLNVPMEDAWFRVPVPGRARTTAPTTAPTHP